MKKLVIYLLAVAIMVSSISVWNPQEVQAASGDVYASGLSNVQAVKGDNAIYFKNNREIKKYDIKKKKITTIAKTKNVGYWELSYCDGFLYYYEIISEKFAKGNIYRFNTKTNKVTTIASVTDMAGGLFLYNGKIYYSISGDNGSSVISMNYDGTGKKTLLKDKIHIGFETLYKGKVYGWDTIYDIKKNKLEKDKWSACETICFKAPFCPGDGINYTALQDGSLKTAKAKYKINKQKIYMTNTSTKKKKVFYTATKESTISELVPAGKYFIVVEKDKNENYSLVLINSKGKKVKELDKYKEAIM